MNGETQYRAAGGKKIVLDSSTIITISDNCMIKILKALSEREGISFLIPESVYRESVETPLRIRRFELNAIRIRDAVLEGYLTLVKSGPEVRSRLQGLQENADRLCTADGQRMRLLHIGEMETLALAKEINADALGIDERTTRMLVEEPENMLAFLRKRHSGKILMDHGAVEEFRRVYGNTKIFRSTEIIALAYEDGSFEGELSSTKQSLEAALFAAKYAGCAVSTDEIKSYMGAVR